MVARELGSGSILWHDFNTEVLRAKSKSSNPLPFYIMLVFHHPALTFLLVSWATPSNSMLGGILTTVAAGCQPGSLRAMVLLVL